MPIRVFSAAVALGLGLMLAASSASAAPGEPGEPVAPALTTASVATQVAVMAPITVPTGSGGLLDAETLSDYTGDAGLLSRQLDAVAGKPIAVAIDPMILVSIRVLGTSAPESARQWLERLSLVSNEVVPLPYANSDVTLATQSGQPNALAPVSFDFALNAANFAETAEPLPAATNEPMDVGGDAVAEYPTTEDLLAWNYAIDGFLRPRAGTVVAKDLTAFADDGVTTTVLSSLNVSRDAGAGSVVSIDGMKALVADSTASAAMDEALDSTLDRDVTVAETALSSAVLAAGAAQSAPTASVLITIDHSLELSTARLDAALASLTASPSITLIPLTSLASGKSTPAQLLDLPHSDARLAELDRMLSAAEQERSFFSIAADPEALVAERRLNLLDVLGTIPADDDASWPNAVDGFLADSRDLRSAVSVEESSNFLLLADNSFLPVSVNNALDQAVTVFITVDPRTGLLAVGNSRVELHIEANSQAQGNIPVRSLSNGVVDVEISLSSGTGLAIGANTVSEINVQAGWETPIVLGVAALVVVIFSVGFVRSIVRRRKTLND